MNCVKKLGLWLLSCLFYFSSKTEETMNSKIIFQKDNSSPDDRLIRYVYCISKGMLAASTSASTASL